MRFAKTAAAAAAAVTLGSGLAVATAGPANAAPTNDVAKVSAGSTVTLSFGKRGADVQRLQRALTAAGYQVPATGYFGSMTKAAVSKYQGDNGMRATGVADQPVWAALQAGKGKPAAAPAAAPAPSRPIATTRPAAGGVSGSCPATWYGSGTMTASGERFNPNAMTAAHKTLPFGTKVKVTNPKTGQSVVVRITDRGPFAGNRCLDLSRGAFAAIGNTSAGVMTVDYQVVS